MHFAFSRTALCPRPHKVLVTTAQKPPSTLESSLTHNSMMTCRPQAHSGNACAPQADTRGHERRTTIWGVGAGTPPTSTDERSHSSGHELGKPNRTTYKCRNFVFVSGCLSHFLCFACFRDVFVKVCTPRGGGLASQHGRCEGNARGITQREHHATWLAVSLARRSTAGAAQAPTSLVAVKTRAVLPHAHQSVHR